MYIKIFIFCFYEAGTAAKVSNGANQGWGRGEKEEKLEQKKCLMMEGKRPGSIQGVKRILMGLCILNIC